MRSKVSVAADSGTHGVLYAMFAVLLALAVLFAAPPVKSQETDKAETTAQTENVTATVTKDGETTAQAGEVTVTTATESGDAEQPKNEHAEQSVQQGAQQTQADPTQDAGSQSTTRAARPLANKPARITESSNDSDGNIANSVIIPNVDCKVSEGASVTVEDASGTRVLLTDGGNVNIRQGGNRIVIAGTGQGGNLNGINAGGQFGPSNGMETGRVVSSTGITCGRDNGNAGGGGNGAVQNESEDGNCKDAKIVETVSGTGDQQSPRFTIVGDSFRVTSQVQISDPQLFLFSITVNDEKGNFVTSISQEREGTNSSFVNSGSGTYFLDVLSLSADYTITVEDCAGVASDDNDVVNDPGGNLPDTGGVPVSILVGCVALLLVGSAVIGTVVTRRR